MVKLLESLGHEVVFLPAVLCCGQAAANAGFKEESKKVLKRFVSLYGQERVECMVVPSASCASFIHYGIEKFFSHDSEALSVKAKVYELSDFLQRPDQMENIYGEYPHKVALHRSCASLREYPGIRDSAARVLQRISGLEVCEIARADECCGFGGTFTTKFPEISASMAADKIHHIHHCQTQKVVSVDMSCLLHLYAYARKHALDLEILHLADLLAAAAGL